VAIRMRRPETAKLEITQDDWLLVKKHLTAGERRQMFGRMYNAGGNMESARVGLARITAYLLDWSVQDAEGAQVVIRDQTQDVIEAALDALDPESYVEILNAIVEHETAMETARATEKNEKDGANGSSAISPSPAPSTGDTSGLVN
jgi:hypothetical protein